MSLVAHGRPGLWQQGMLRAEGWPSWHRCGRAPRMPARRFAALSLAHPEWAMTGGQAHWVHWNTHLLMQAKVEVHLPVDVQTLSQYILQGTPSLVFCRGLK